MSPSATSGPPTVCTPVRPPTGVGEYMWEAVVESDTTVRPAPSSCIFHTRLAALYWFRWWQGTLSWTSLRKCERSPTPAVGTLPLVTVRPHGRVGWLWRCIGRKADSACGCPLACGSSQRPGPPALPRWRPASIKCRGVSVVLVVSEGPGAAWSPAPMGSVDRWPLASLDTQSPGGSRPTVAAVRRRDRGVRTPHPRPVCRSPSAPSRASWRE